MLLARGGDGEREDGLPFVSGRSIIISAITSCDASGVRWPGSAVESTESLCDMIAECANQRLKRQALFLEWLLLVLRKLPEKEKKYIDVR